MSQSIHSGSRSQVRRKCKSHLGIQYCIGRNQRKIIHGVFMFFLTVRNNCRNGHFTSGPCRSRDCYQHWDLAKYFQQTFQFPKRLFRISNPCSHSLCTVHGRTTAKSNQCLALFLQIQFPCFLHIMYCRISTGIVIYSTMYVIFSQQFFQMRCTSHVAYSLIRDKQHRGNLLFY